LGGLSLSYAKLKKNIKTDENFYSKLKIFKGMALLILLAAVENIFLLIFNLFE